MGQPNQHTDGSSGQSRQERDIRYMPALQMVLMGLDGEAGGTDADVAGKNGTASSKELNKVDVVRKIIERLNTEP